MHRLIASHGFAQRAKWHIFLSTLYIALMKYFYDLTLTLTVLKLIFVFTQYPPQTRCVSLTSLRTVYLAQGPKI